MPDPTPRLTVWTCEACGLAWLYPRPVNTVESVTSFVHDYESQLEGSYFDPARRHQVASLELAFLDSVCRRRGKLLDVGAGDGTFISHATDSNWRCVGIDPAARLNPAIAAQAASRFRLLAGTLDLLGPSERFDVVTLWDVVEHLDEPESALHRAIEYLADDGIMVVETGNFESVDRIIAGENWWGYIPDHRWYFSPSNLAAMLRRVGLPHVALLQRVLRPGWKGSARYAGPSRLATFRKALRSPLAARKLARQHALLAAAATKWPEWAGLGIFCVVASRQPIASNATAPPLFVL